MAKRKTNDLMIIVDYSQDLALSLAELCDICGSSPEFIHNLIEYEIIYPRGESPEEWVFDLTQLQRAKTALRLQRDLDMNIAGVAVVLDLLDELTDLRAKVKLMEKHYF